MRHRVAAWMAGETSERMSACRYHQREKIASSSPETMVPPPSSAVRCCCGRYRLAASALCQEADRLQLFDAANVERFTGLTKRSVADPYTCTRASNESSTDFDRRYLENSFCGNRREKCLVCNYREGNEDKEGGQERYSSRQNWADLYEK